nr:cell wall-binding repeat-containing protein [Mobiluncus sp. Marseille-Q7826]
MNLKKKFVIGAASVALVAGMGGVAAPAAVADIANPGFVNKLVRLGGMDRVSTSLKVAAYEFGSRVEKTDPRGARPEVLYVTSYADGNLVDAASAGMLTDGPIAFVSNNSYVAEAVGKFFADTKTNSGFAAIKKVVAIGGEGAVSDATLKAVAKQLGANVATGRLGGKDRYETSVAIAEHIYSQALLKDNYYKDRAKQRIVNIATSNLTRVYLANGADSHVVDSMVAGTLDNGPVLLVQPDGKIPEVAAEFIKKALPEQFAALGGAETVSDATVQEAWLIKTLANKWDTSSEIPDLYKNAKNLRNLVYGMPNGSKNSRDVLDPNFMGLQRIVADADAIYRDWNGKAGEQKGIINAATNRLAHATTKFGTKAAGFYKEVLDGSGSNADIKAIHGALIKLYGDLITTTPGGTAIDPAKVTIASFMTDSSGANGVEADYALASGFNFTEIEGSTAYRQAVKAGTDDLDNGWSKDVNPVLGTQVKTKTAQASQYMVADNTVNNSLTTGTVDNTVSGAVITDLTKYVLDSEKSWLDQYKKALEKAEQGLRLEQDKIAPKTELRLGGKDRFETAQLIANQYGNLYGGVLGLSGHFTEAYVANGTRLPDSLTAGQLSRGPILLVRAEGDLPEFTVTVAKKLKSWTNADHLIAVAIGETGVLPDEQFKKVADLINGGKELPLVGSRPATPATASATPTLGTVNGSPITAANGTASVPVTGAKAAPAVYTCTIDTTEIAPAAPGTGKVKFDVAWDATANACKVTATDESHSGAVTGTIKVTVTVDEDGTGTAKTVSAGADANVTVNIA